MTSEPATEKRRREAAAPSPTIRYRAIARTKVALVIGAASVLPSPRRSLKRERGSGAPASSKLKALLRRRHGSRAAFKCLDVRDEAHWRGRRRDPGRGWSPRYRRQQRWNHRHRCGPDPALSGASVPRGLALGPTHQSRWRASWLQARYPSHATTRQGIDHQHCITGRPSRHSGGCCLRPIQSSCPQQYEDSCTLLHRAGTRHTCNAVVLAAVWTPIWKSLLGDDPDRQRTMDGFVADTSLRRFGEPRGVAALVGLLESDEATS